MLHPVYLIIFLVEWIISQGSLEWTSEYRRAILSISSFTAHRYVFSWHRQAWLPWCCHLPAVRSDREMFLGRSRFSGHFSLQFQSRWWNDWFWPPFLTAKRDILHQNFLDDNCFLKSTTRYMVAPPTITELSPVNSVPIVMSCAGRHF